MSTVQRKELTVVTPIRREAVDDLRRTLQAVSSAGMLKRDLRAKCPEVHFARVALLERRRPVPALVAGTLLPSIETPLLLFGTTFDGSRPEHLANLAHQIPAYLDLIYQYCPGYPAPTARRRPSEVTDYLARNRIRANTFFVGTPGISVAEVLLEAALSGRIEQILDFVGKEAGDDPVHFHLLVREHIEGDAQLKGMLEAPMPPRPRGLLGGIGWIVGALRGPQDAQTPPKWFPGPGRFRWLVLGFARWTERSDQPPPPGQAFPFPDPTWLALQVQRMRDSEHEEPNRTNRLTLYSDVKPGLFRRLVLSGSLLFLDAGARATLDGRLSGFEGIHAARWVMVEGGRKLLFISDYDGAWEEYLTAFSKNLGVARGVTSIWSSAETFPRTRYLLCGGAIHEGPFKQAVRANQIVTQVRYSAYDDPRFTVQFINRNRRIRCGLAQEALSAQEAVRWLEEFR